MKKNIFTLLLIGIPWIMNCQEWQYSSVINGTSIEPRYSTIDQQGNVYILSFFSGSIVNPVFTSYGSGDLLLCKMSPTGTLLWYDRIGGTGNDLAGGMNIADGFLYVTGGFNNTCNFNGGTSQLTSAGVTDMFLAKYSLSGEFQYARIVGTFPTVQVTQHIKADNNYHLLMTGYFRDSVKIGYTGTPQKIIKGTPGIVSNFIALLDLEGNCIWAKSISGTHTDSRFQRIGISENGYYFGGFFKGDLTFDLGPISSYVATTFDAFVYKTDFDGNGQWIRRIRGSSTENFKTLTTDEYDNVYVLGNFNSATIYVDSTSALTQSYAKSAGPNYDTYMAKYNRSGILQWFLIKGGTGKDIYNDFVIRNNVIYATGYFANQIIFNNDTLRTDNTLNEDAFLAAFNQIGNPISGISIKGTGNYNDAGSIVRMDANSRAYVAGYFKSQQIQIGSQIYASGDVNASDQFFAVYKQPFKAVITDEQMVSCNGLSDGMLKVTPYFGKPPFIYSWSHNPGLNNPVADNLPAGDYTVTITDANDSIASIAGTVTQTAALAIDAVVTSVACFNNNEGAIAITVTGGKQTSGYSYSWTTHNGSGIDPVGEDQSGLSAGDYSVTVLDDNDCSVSADYTLTQPAKISYANIAVTHLVPPSYNTGSVSLTVIGGTGSYTFAWDGPDPFTSSDEDISGLDVAGTYELSVTDGNGCIADTNFTIIDDHTFIAELSAKTDVLCFGESTGSASITVYNGAGTLNFQWSDATNMGTSNIRTDIAAGNYTVTISDGVSPTIQLPVNINEPSAGLAIALDTLRDLRCNNDNSGVIGITAFGGTLPYSFAWDNGTNGEDLVNVSADEYTVVVTDGNNCVAQRTETIGEPGALLLGMPVTSAILCHGDKTASATVSASGGNPGLDYPYYDYLWDDPGTQTTPTADDLGAGTYHVSVTDSIGCSITTVIEILEPDPLSFASAVNNPSCPGMSDGSIVITPVGGTGPGYDYIWSNNVFNRINTDIPSGEYILTFNDENYCTLVDTFFLDDPDTLVISTVEITDVSCLGKTDGSLTINAEGGTGILEYSTDNGLNYVTSPVFNALAGGNYTLLVKDEKDCVSDSYLATLAVLDTVKIALVEVTDVTCLGLADGSVSITASGGTGIYEYSIDGGENFVTTASIGSLTLGDYTVVVTDDNDCLSEDYPVSLVALDTVEILSVDKTNLTCSGVPDGSILITASGGSGTYEYSTDGGVTYLTNSTFNSMANGSYDVVVRDDNNCISVNEEVTLTMPEACGMVIYDAFSPNGDDKNPVWTIGNVGSFPKIKVKIFNLWGKEVFNSSGYATPWDGTYEGKDLPAGTYYYVIDPGDESDVLTGAVSIVK
jgi:gliding motility-associated-like protein